MEDRIVELLGAGTPPHVVAQVVGCDPSYVSQLGAREDIQERIMEIRAANAGAVVKHDASIFDLEKEALAKMERLLPMQSDLMKVTRVFEILNRAKKASDFGVVGTTNQPGTVVTLQLPAAAHLHFKVTTDQQVIEIEGRSMVPLPSHMVAAQLKNLKADRLLASAQATEAKMVDFSASGKSRKQSLAILEQL